MSRLIKGAVDDSVVGSSLALLSTSSAKETVRTRGFPDGGEGEARTGRVV